MCAMKQSRLAYIQMRDQFVNELAVEGKKKVTISGDYFHECYWA